MKRLTIFLLVAAMFIGSIYAQPMSERTEPEQPEQQEQQRTQQKQRAQNGEVRQRESNPVTVEGTLKLERGFVAVDSGDTVYYVPMLNRYIGFINDLKEGAAVSVEGHGFRNIIQPTKVTIGETSYDFPALSRVFAFGHNFNPRQPQTRTTPRFNHSNRNNSERTGRRMIN